MRSRPFSQIKILTWVMLHDLIIFNPWTRQPHTYHFSRSAYQNFDLRRSLLYLYWKMIRMKIFITNLSEEIQKLSLMLKITWFDISNTDSEGLIHTLSQDSAQLMNPPPTKYLQRASSCQITEHCSFPTAIAHSWTKLGFASTTALAAVCQFYNFLSLKFISLIL